MTPPNNVSLRVGEGSSLLLSLNEGFLTTSSGILNQILLQVRPTLSPGCIIATMQENSNIPSHLKGR